MKSALIFFMLCFGIMQGLQAQVVEKSSLDVDDIEILVKDVLFTGKKDTVIVELFLNSYKKNPREFKLNTFATGIIGVDGTPLFYSTIQLEKVFVDIKDRQNYIHYLLKGDVPVLLRIATVGWQKRWGKPQQLKLTFEDSTEEGKFLDVLVDL
ncbi:hypothetical protein ACL9RF_09060 [Sphingobacterium sp. Mn56C]|uniref:hypothetical protein n=1 Tax=Sphingobacterium sp. Mn56C TaxID=3395261 RepID=UPI003BDB8E0E